MRRNIVWRGVLLALALTLLAGCGAPSGPSGSGSGAENLTLLTIGTADSGGTMYQAGSAIAQVITQEDSLEGLDYTTFAGVPMAGRPEKVFLRGRLVAENGRYVGPQGGGKRVLAKPYARAYENYTPRG